ncbi:MAG: DUF4382 domain-containing protein [Ketobacteraceae bacterium]|nr:DUF4382 domain-containing protein [Ketobacteraceae bacterium]
MLKQRIPVTLAGLLAAPVLLTGCGGSSSSGSSTGSLSVNITDAAVDNADEVVVSFTGITIKPANQSAVTFSFTEAKSIDLLQLQGNNSTSLITDEEVLAGRYNWVRLEVADAYIVVGGQQFDLTIPSASQTGLKLVSGFDVLADSSSSFTIDFDLRKSVIENNQGYQLKPTLRLIDNSESGSIAGTISSNVLTGCANATAADDGAVYLYAGSDITPIDVQGNESDPITSSMISVDGDSNYAFELGFLPVGDYTITLVCDATADDPEQADTLEYTSTANVSVTAGTETGFNFTL